uniref:hypothetical protein n=1 Tax=Arhodomonas sp. KWT TaxID=2679915 RepID=UPI00196A07B4
MSATLAQRVPLETSNPADRYRFFTKDQNETVNRHAVDREHRTDPKNPCDTNLFIGVFFDGTG